MDEKVLEEIQFHQETVEHDSNSPLHLIREKEMEISGKVLTAKKRAEEIVADARRQAVEMLQAAEEEGDRLAREHEKKVLADVDREAEQIKKDTESQIAALEASVTSRRDNAVDFVVRTVSTG